METVEILHGHAGVEVVRAGGEDVLARRRRLVRDDRIDGGIEKLRLQAGQQLIERLARLQREDRAARFSRVRRGGERRRSALKNELARRQIVVWSAVDPEQLRIARN